MKLVLLVFNAAIEDQVLARLTELGGQSFTVVPKVFGKGTRSEPRMDTHVWPGYHRLYLLALDEGEWSRVRPFLQELSRAQAEEGFRTFVLSLEEFF